MKDVVINPDAPQTLLLDKHADYIAAYGSKKDDYVSKDSRPTYVCILGTFLIVCVKPEVGNSPLFRY